MADNDAVAKEFGEWLFPGEHRDPTIIAHSFHSYDNHFILKYLLDNQHTGVKVIRRGTQLLDLQCEKAKINAREHIKLSRSKIG